MNILKKEGPTFLNLVSTLGSNSKKVICKLFIFLPIVLIILTIGYGYLTIHTLTEHHVHTLNNIKTIKKDLIIATISENCKKANLQTTNTKNDIIARLKYIYGDDFDRMRHDYESEDINTPFYQILSQALTNKYINQDNDRNRLFIASRNKILLDNSILYSKYSFTTWEDFFKNNSHPNFSKRAIRLMQEQNDTTILWVDNEFEIDAEGYTWDPAYDLANFLNDKIDANQLEELNKFSILIAEYIYQHEDIFGIPDVIGGTFTNNDKLYIVQLVSIKDIIDTTPKLLEALQKWDVEKAKENDYYRQTIRYRTIITIGLVSIEILIFFSIWFLLEYYIYSNRYTQKLNTLYEKS